MALPRGCEAAVLDLLNVSEVAYTIQDEREKGQVLTVHFNGQLCEEQAEAVHVLMQYDQGKMCIRDRDYRSSGLYLKKHGWEGNLFGSFQQTLPWDLRLSLNGGGGTPHISLQGKSSSFYYYAIG